MTAGAVGILALLGAAGAAAPPSGREVEASLERARLARLPVSLEYDKDLSPAAKLSSVFSTQALLRDLGIDVAHEPAQVAAVVAASEGRISARPVGDPHLLYDAVYYLTDLVRLPPALHPLFSRILIVDDLERAAPRSGERRDAAIAWETRTATLVVDHENLNQLELFGNFVHPKVNFAMLLEVAVEARLARLGNAALRELGLDIVLDDNEWARLNGGAAGGWSAYSGEDVSFVGVKTAARLTPPGIVFDALRELKSGVPADAYAGMPEAQPPWLSPRRGPEADRQSILRCLFGRDPAFYDRLGGRNGVRQDRILREKTRLILYAAFVGSGGVLDHAYWMKRHRGNEVVDELTRDFDASFLARLNERLDRNDDTRGLRIEPARH